MNLKYVFGTALVVSLCVNAVFFMSSMKPGGTVTLNSYANAATIEPGTAQTMANAYAESAPEGVHGGIIAGQAFERIFNVAGTNGIAYRLAIDETNGIANGVFLVIEGADVTTHEGVVTSYRKTGSSVYIPNTWCPPSCVNIE